MAVADADWLAVPGRVRDLYVKYAAQAREILAGDTMPLLVTPYGNVVLRKEAAQPWSAMANAFGTASKALGGPNPLVTALLTGALTAGAGYGAGSLAGALFPDKFVDRKKLRRNLAIGGGALGALMGGYLHGKPLVQQHGIKGLLMPGPATLSTPPKDDFWKQVPPADTPDTLQEVSASLHVDFEIDPLYKKAFDSIAGTVLPTIPKDEFNQMVMRDPYLSLPMRAGTMGLMEAASQSRGGAQLVSPLDIGRVAIGMGSGLASGMLVGKVLGALAGITPDAQQGLQRAGVMAGLLSNIVPRAFGR